MPATAANTDLGARLETVERTLRDLRGERAEKSGELERRKRLFAASGEDTEGPLFRGAKRAADELREVDGRMEDARKNQVAMLQLISGGTPGDDALDGADARVTERLKSEPGRWLAAALDRRRGEVPHLDEKHRQKALTVGSNVSVVEEASAFFDLLTPAVVTLASGVNVITTEGTKVRVPRFTSLPAGSWIAERAAFPIVDPGLVVAEIEPDKAGLVTVISIELMEDIQPEVLAGVQLQIMRGVARTLDSGLLAGSGVAPIPLGILGTAGTVAIAGGLTSLAAFADAVGSLVAAGAAPSVIILNPTNFRSLLGVMEQTGSNVPLLPASGGQGFTVKHFPGIRWYISAALPAGKALCFDAGAVTAVIRRPADLSIDPYYGFATGEIALRSYVRADVIVNSPTGVAVLTLT